ncbi:hypothetical protein AnigIFM59636_006141 [Aspergillus niger]|nr:hypothetical protein AnigIFM59636_006141 [Aspergillus niger]
MPRYTPNQYYGEPSNIGHQLDYIPGGGRGRSFVYPHARTLSLSQNQHSGLPAYPQRDPRSSNTQPTMSRTTPGSVSGVSPGDGSPNTPDLTSSTAVVPPALRPRGYVPPSARTQQGTQHPASTTASPVPTSSSYYQQSQAQQHSHTAGPFSHLPPHPEEFDDGAYIAPLVTSPAQSSSANFVTTGTPPSRSMNAGNSRYGRPLPQRLELARRAHLLGHHYNPQAAQAIVEAHMQLQRQRQRQRQGLGTHPTKPSASLDNAKDGRPEPKEAHEMRVSLECKVCFTQLVDTVLLPCGHAVLCRWCAEIQIPNSILERGLLGGQPPCVICRAPVKQKVKADVEDFPGSLTIAHTDLGTQCYGHPPCIDTHHWIAATYHLGLNGREGEGDTLELQLMSKSPNENGFRPCIPRLDQANLQQNREEA